MNRRKLMLIREKVQAPDFRAIVELLLERCDRFDEMKQNNSQKAKQHRAKREGISVEQIEEEALRESAKYALRPDEKKKIADHERQSIEKAKTDEKLFRLVLVSEITEREHEQHWLNWKKLPPENKPLQQELVDFLDENRRLLGEFGAAKGWSIPEGY